MSAAIATSSSPAVSSQLRDRVKSLERLCRTVAGRGGARAAAGRTAERQVISTGLPSLDRLLPRAGIRPGSLIEWLEPAAETGIETAAGAAAFALAVAVRLQAAAGLPPGRSLVVVDRGGRFYPPAVLPWLADPETNRAREASRPARHRRRGVAGSNAIRRTGSADRVAAGSDRRLYVVRPDSEADEIWAIDQSLRCPEVAAVVGWPRQISVTALRRWQLAAESSGAAGLLVRPATSRHEPTWSEVRIQVQPIGCSQAASGCRGPAARPAGQGARPAGQGARPDTFLPRTDSQAAARESFFQRQPTGWIDVRAFRLVRVGGGWESATAVAEASVDCLLDLTCGRERPLPAEASGQPAWYEPPARSIMTCRAS